MNVFWSRLPVVVRALVIGVAAAGAGTIPWAALMSANTQHQSAIPWAAPIMALYLWVYWRYLVRGSGWPQSTADARRMNARANALPHETWGPALLAGLLGLASVLLLQGVLSRLIALPQQQDLDVSRYPAVTILIWVVMSAVVTGVVEETSFRGYLQRPIERRHGPAIAILITGILFGFAHFAHPEVGLVLLPFYIAAAAVYGALAYFTQSTLPGMVLHAGGNMFSAFDLLTRGRSEWQLSADAQSLVWQTGPDMAFWATVAALLIFTGLTVWAYLTWRARCATPGHRVLDETTSLPETNRRWRRPVCAAGVLREAAAGPLDAQTQAGRSILVDPKPLFELSPYLYMQFMEPLGATDGSVEAAWDHARDEWREDVVEVTRALAPPMMRWGGIFADFYRWREGVGPRDRRPSMLNLLWGGIESNQVGTGEFVELCRHVAAQPLICVNFESDGRKQYMKVRDSMRTADAREAAEWVAYCNDPDNRERKSHGHAAPLDVRHWQDRERDVLRQEWLRSRNRGAQDRRVCQGHACGRSLDSADRVGR